jgi:hypothetical protein
MEVSRVWMFQFLSTPIVAVRVVVAIAGSRIPLLVAMFVAMFVDVISVVASIAAIATCHSNSSHHH